MWHLGEATGAQGSLPQDGCGCAWLVSRCVLPRCLESEAALPAVAGSRLTLRTAFSCAVFPPSWSSPEKLWAHAQLTPEPPTPALPELT